MAPRRRCRTFESGIKGSGRIADIRTHPALYAGCCESTDDGRTLTYKKAWEILRDAKAPRWPRRGVFASGAKSAPELDPLPSKQPSHRGVLRLRNPRIDETVGACPSELVLHPRAVETLQERSQEVTPTADRGGSANEAVRRKRARE